MAAVVRVEGVDDILRRMAKIAPAVQKKYLAASVRAVSKPHIKDVKSLVKRGPTGNLKRSVGVVVEKKRKARTAVAILGFRRGGGGKAANQKGFHAWWIEHGVKARKAKRGLWLFTPWGRRRAVAGFAGTGKFRRWADSKLPGIRNDLVRVLGQNVDKAIAEEARRQKKAAERR